VVSTPIEAARELLGGVPGTVIAASHEPAAIAGAVCDLLDQVRDRRIRGEIAQAAAARFDLAEAARQFSELLDSVRPSVTAAGRRTPAPGGR
jgi:glycosyltransferase involved in cell wall biosynthesis